MEGRVNEYEKMEMHGDGETCFCRGLYQVAMISVNYKLWSLAEGKD